MAYRIKTRSQYGLDPVVRNTNGTPRPALRLPLKFVVYHYTGVNVRFGDIGDTDAEIRSIDAWAQSVGKPNEYNTVIHQDPDDWIHEYAGMYRAAHAAGINGVAEGRLLLNGVKEPMTPLQLDKIKWLNQEARAWGIINEDTRHVGHRDAPNASTSCPGDLIMPNLWFVNEPPMAKAPSFPKPPPAPVVPVAPPDSTDVGHYLVIPGRTAWGISAEVYGTGTRFQEILDANAPDLTPNPGERWKVPGFKGEFVEVAKGDGPWAILNRVFGSGGWDSRTGIEQFWQWNGGEHMLKPGEVVWVRH